MFTKVFMVTVVSLFLTCSAQAGGSSVAGPGAPTSNYACYEMSFDTSQIQVEPPNFEVTVGRYWPDYGLQIMMVDRSKGVVVSEKAETKTDETVGGAVVTLSESLRLEVYPTTAPILENGHTFSASQLLLKRGGVINLKCEQIDN